MVSVASILAGARRVTDDIDTEVRWVVHGLLAEGGRAMIVAPPKAGKTSTITDLAWALASGEAFLRQSTHLPSDRTVHVIDLEMTAAQSMEWHRKRAAGAPREVADRVLVSALRGHISDADFTDAEVRAVWIEALRQQKCGILIIDCLAPLIAAAGLDENSASEVQKLLAGIDEVAYEAGLLGVITAHHAGKGAGTRGSSALDGSGDSIWRLSRQRRGRLKVTVTGRDTSGTYSGFLAADSGRVIIDSWTDIDGVEDRVVHDSPDTTPEAMSVPSFDATRDFILEELADKGTLTRRAFRNRSGYQDAIDGLIEEGRVVEDTSERGKKSLRLAEDVPMAA
mgnify:FL=1